MKNLFCLSMLAGMALSASAGAQTLAADAKQAIRRAPAAAIRATVNDVTARSNQLVYAVNDTDGFIFTAAIAPKEIMEDVSVIPGPGSNGTFPLTINGMDLSFAVTSPLADFDIEVTFWDSVDVAAVGSPAHITPIDGFVVGIDSTLLPADGAYTTGVIDLTGLPSGGIVLPDAGCFVLIRYVEPGTTDLTSAAVEAVLDEYNDLTTFASNLVGASDSLVWFDINGDGIIDGGEGRVFAYPGRGGPVIALQADVPDSGGNPCPADFNGDQFVDFFDYDGFVTAFEQGC